MTEKHEKFDWAAEPDCRMWETEIARIAALQLVRELWVSLLKEGVSMTSCELAREVATIEKIHSYFETQKSSEAVVEVSSLVNLRAERAMARAFRRLQAD